MTIFCMMLFKIFAYVTLKSMKRETYELARRDRIFLYFVSVLLE